ncbi:MAG: ABC transporter ATP-binding protein/permease [Oscillospiraceae bacterium]|nr:ABC transporter ATP-binding protein/permease [Oscillospiraceae bacterium]
MRNSTIQWIFSVAGKNNLNIVILTLLQAVQGASGVLYALLLKAVVDAASGHDPRSFWLNLVCIILLAAVQLGLRALIRWLTEHSKSNVENAFKRRLTDTILGMDHLRAGAVHSGEWLNRLTSDTSVVANGYVDILPGIAGMVVKLVSALVMIVVLEPVFALILVPVGVLMVVLSWLFRKRLKRLHKMMQEADGRLRVFLQERIESLLVIHSFAAEEQTSEKASERMEEHKKARMKKNNFSILCNLGFGAAMSGMYLLGVGWCGYGILIGTVTFGTLTAITQLISQIESPFASISGYLPRYYSMTASGERLIEAEKLEGGLEPARPLGDMLDLYRGDLRSIGAENVSFRYYQPSAAMSDLDKSGMADALSGFSAEISKGETVAFTGHSGCGKSTALKLLMCVYAPDAGHLYYTAADGEKHELTPAYRRLFAYVPQGNLLMSGSIRDIVSYARPELSGDGERIDEALRASCAYEFVHALDNGVDTVLGERGTGLSEGQMQRLAIARAVFSGSPVLLLDEATSSLDQATEARLLENLRAMNDRTVVIVTHRQAALAICDRTVDFEKGEDAS